MTKDIPTTSIHYKRINGDHAESRDICRRFIEAFAQRAKSKKHLSIQHVVPYLQLLLDVNGSKVHKYIENKELDNGLIINSEIQSLDAENNLSYEPFPPDGKYDLVTGEFSYGRRIDRKEIRFEIKDPGPKSKEFTRWEKDGWQTFGGTDQLREYAEWAIIKSTEYISDDGYGIFPVNQAVIKSGGFLHQLRERSFDICGYINCPINMYESTNLRPVMIVIKPGMIIDESTPYRYPKYFLGELNEFNAPILAGGFLDGIKPEGNLETGLWADQFNGFNKWKSVNAIKKLETEYKNYSQVYIEDLALGYLKINKSTERFEEVENCVYFPIAKSVNKKTIVYTVLEEITPSHKGYYQIKLDPKQILAEYFSAFYRSEIGKLLISDVGGDTSIHTLNQISATRISVPPLEEQERIISVIKKLDELRKNILIYENELALNPTSEDAVTKIDEALAIFGALSDADKVLSLIRSMESLHLEFKETFTWDIKKQSKETYLSDSVIKTIAGFLNKDGGTLLVGVADNGEIKGLNTEIDKLDKSVDAFIRRFNDVILKRIGEGCLPFLSWRTVTINKRLVLLVECKRSSEEIYTDEDFWVRLPAATVKLQGRDLVTYCNERFPKR